jgi:hypothetical protein
MNYLLTPPADLPYRQKDTRANLLWHVASDIFETEGPSAHFTNETLYSTDRFRDGMEERQCTHKTTLFFLSFMRPLDQHTTTS